MELSCLLNTATGSEVHGQRSDLFNPYAQDKLNKTILRATTEINPVALRTAKTQLSFGRSEWNRIKECKYLENLRTSMLVWKPGPDLVSDKNISLIMSDRSNMDSIRTALRKIP